MAMIACVDLDPFLVGLVQRVRPDDEVVVVAADALTPRRSRRYAAVIMGAGSTARPGNESPRLAERTVLVSGQREGWGPPDHPGPVIRRPVDVGELRLALARVAPPGRWSQLRGRLATLPAATSPGGVFAVARVGAVTGAAVLAVTDAAPGPPAVLVLAVAVWALTRVWVRETSVGLVSVDLAFAAVAIMLTAGAASPFLLFAAVVAAEVGYAYPSTLGATVIGMATIAGLVPLAVEMSRNEATAADLIGWGALIPLSSVLGVMAQRLRRGRARGQLQLLSELHATLDQLSKQAQGVAGALELTSVVDHVTASLREDLGARAGVLLLGDGEVHDVVGPFGLDDGAPSRVVVAGDTARGGVPHAIAAVLPRGEVMTSRLMAMGVDRGAIVAVVGEGEATRERDDALAALATEAAVSIDNARLFEGIRQLTVDDERRRIARDLHDGVVQSLVHVRFELDLVRRMLDIPQAEEIEHLREVVGQAVDEVRATVNDLRSVRLSAGLGTALLSVAREYERPGLRVVVDAGPIEMLTPEAELQLLRIAQEAVSNAVHHGASTVVYVHLWEDTDEVHLQVLDDGIGLDNGSVDPSRGVGLHAMQERADLLGAALDLGPGVEGGTCVQVDVPVGRMSV